MKKISILFALLFCSTAATAQLTPDLAAKLENKSNTAAKQISPIKAGDVVAYGVGQKIAGSDFKYSFPVKGVSNSMLIRATDGTQSMEWLSDSVPSAMGKSGYVNYIIPVAIGTNSRFYTMSFEIDGSEAFVIDNRDEPMWSLSDNKGRSLTFQSIFVDGNRDRRGFFYLRIPRAELGGDRSPLRMKITADARGSQAWFMVFTDKITPSNQVQLSPAIIKGKQQLMIDVMHFGAPVKAVIKLDGRTVGSKTVAMGGNTFTVSIDKVDQERDAVVEIITDGKSEKLPIKLKPSRNWQLYFVQHTHTDIGYTRPQNEILAEHIRYIDYALDYCDLTDNMPAEAQFRWTCETSWAVEQFLKTRPAQQIERLKQRIKEGRIEVAGMIFNFTELPDEQTLAASLQPLKECRRADIPVEVAMQNDVNGMAWTYADYLSQIGVKYLNMGTHGHRALICFDYPTVFRWQSPSGAEMIGYRAEHYNTGNFFGIEKSNFEDFEVRLLTYLMELEAKGYPYDIAAIQFSGYFTDNSPPSIAACYNVEKWNAKYTSPRIELAVSTKFLKRIEKEHYASLPILKQAWPDWWTDGAGAAAREAAIGRYSKTDILANGAMLSIAALKGAQIPADSYREIDDINRAILFYDEHTTGYSESVRQPWSKPTMDQRALKESYAWEAYRKSRTLSETAAGLLQQYVKKADVPSIVVYNTLNFPRTGIAEAYIDHEVLPIDRQYSIIDGSTGQPIAAQRLDSRADGTYWQLRVEDIPALGHKQLLIKVSDQKREKEILEATIAPIVESPFYKIEFDTKKGVIKSLFDKELSTELLKSNDGRDLGEFVYEQLAERGSMESFTMGAHSRRGLDTVWFAGVKRGAIYDSYNFAGRTIAGIDTPAANFAVEYRVHHNDKLVEMNYSLTKKSVIEPEAIYIALPFGLESSSIYCEVPGGVMQAGVDQIKGSSNDWNTHQNFVAVRNNKAQVVVGSSEAPLMQFGGINTGRYKAGAMPQSSNIYSWVMNNYWVTNFNAEQRGEFTWKYYLTSLSDNSNSAATKFGWGARVPMPVRVLSADKNGSSQLIPSVKGEFEIAGGDFLLISAMPVEAERAVILHLREISGVQSTVKIEGYKIEECDVLGDTMAGGTLDVKPCGVKFIKLTY